MHASTRLTSLATLLATLLAALPAQEIAHPELEVASVRRIWERARHNAFTSLVHANDRWYCAFREGERHVHGKDGVVRVIVSDDLEEWSSLARLATDGVDLRDPKLAVMPDGRIMMVIGGSHYRDRELVVRRPMVAFSNDELTAFDAPIRANIDAKVATDVDWLWRLTWHEGTGYGIVYQPDRSDWHAQLVTTKNGIDYAHVCELPCDGWPGEVTLRFLPDGRMAVLARRESGSKNAAIGVSSAPFTEWTFTELPLRLGGPDFAVLADGRLLACGRRYHDDKTYSTELGWMDLLGTWEKIATLPSGGDTSYPGIVVDDDHIYVSYYSSHEGKASIYLATLQWRPSAR